MISDQWEIAAVGFILDEPPGVHTFGYRAVLLQDGHGDLSWSPIVSVPPQSPRGFEIVQRLAVDTRPTVGDREAACYDLETGQRVKGLEHWRQWAGKVMRQAQADREDEETNV